MKNTLLYFCLIFIIGCKKEIQKPKTARNSAQNCQIPLNYFDSVNINSSEPYKLKLNLKSQKSNSYDLSIAMELNNGAHFVSPNAKRDFKGKFKIYFDETTHLKQVGKLIEIPLSVEEYDEHPFVNGTVNWVRENTVYHQKIKRLKNEDFKVDGYIQFTIEPRCTLEKIPFTLKQVNGKMTINSPNC